MRPRGEPLSFVDAADAEFRHVATLTADGDLAGARTRLRRLSERAEEAGEPVLAGKALRLSATLDRALGDLTDAVAAARRAADLAGPDDELAMTAYAELAESLMALGHPADAATAYGRAADRAATAEATTALRRMQAFALGAAGRAEESTALLDELAGDTGDPGARAALLVQAAGAALSHAGDMTGVDATRLWREAYDAVNAGGVAAGPHHAMRADLAFIAAASALDARDPVRALGEIRAARRHALAGVAVLQYLAAAIAESAVAELTGDDTAAYGSLATGYATLGDVVGKPLSASTFTGPLRALRDRWGPDRFADAKRAYEDERRRARVT